MTKVRRIAEEQSADHIVVQAPSSADLEVLAKTFTVADESGAVLSDVARIQSMATVIDAGSFLRSLQGRAARDVIERIELANVIVIDGVDESDPATVKRLTLLLEALNPGARIARTDDDPFTLSSLRTEEPFALRSADDRAEQAHSPSEHSDAIVRFAYEARLPFHPARLHRLLQEQLSGVVRMEGVFWVASRPDLAVALDIAGQSRTTAVRGMWWASVPEGERPDSAEFKQYLEANWHAAFGDRYQELSIVGVDVDEGALRARLQQCLLTEEELCAPESWAGLPDPFRWKSLGA